MQPMAMPVAHRPSQSGQWQQLQSQWEQHQQHMQQQQHDHQHHPHHDQHPYYQHRQHQPPYEDYYPTDPTTHHSPYPTQPYHPPHPANPSIPPLLLRIAVSPSRTEDLPIALSPPPDLAAIAERFCADHGVVGPGKLDKLLAMVQRSVEQHRQQYAPAVQQLAVESYEPPYATDGQYEQAAYGGGYYDEPQAYAEQYGGQYAMAPMATTPPPYSLERVNDTEPDDASPLQPTFTPSRPTSAMSHTAAVHHSRHASSSTASFSHSQPTPSLRPSSLTLPASSSPSPRSLSTASPRPISPHTAGYLAAPAAVRLYANAAIKQRQLARHIHQKQQLDAERRLDELSQCTFRPTLGRGTGRAGLGSVDRRGLGRRQYEWIEDWNGEKRGRRLERMREAEGRRVQQEECSFTPTVNAVSHQLVQLSKANPARQAKANKANKGAHQPSDDKAKKQQVLDKDAKAKIAQFLQRTVERQQSHKQALQRLQQDNLKHITPTFVPTITATAQSTPAVYNKPRPAVPAAATTTAEADSARSPTAAASQAAAAAMAVPLVLSASVQKRQRKCDEIYRCFGDRCGYMDRRRWMKLAKEWYMADSIGGGAGLGGMRYGLDRDDVAVVELLIRECDRQVRRDRKAGRVLAADGLDGDGAGDEWTWQLSLADFKLWMERLFHVVLKRAQSAEREEERMVQKFISTPDP